jgi:hypothetical protein
LALRVFTSGHLFFRLITNTRVQHIVFDLVQNDRVLAVFVADTDVRLAQFSVSQLVDVFTEVSEFNGPNTGVQDTSRVNTLVKNIATASSLLLFQDLLLTFRTVDWLTRFASTRLFLARTLFGFVLVRDDLFGAKLTFRTGARRVEDGAGSDTFTSTTDNLSSRAATRVIIFVAHTFRNSLESRARK